MEPEQGRTLLAIARGAIAEGLGEAAPPIRPAPWLQEFGATFVTLHLGTQLRGCIGTLQAHRPLGRDVALNAGAAAFQDDRFEPIGRREFRDLDIEVSLLSPLEALAFENQEQLLTRLRPGVDGLVLEYQGRRGTFLPQVWQQVPEPAAFLAHLKQKAGLPADFWAEGIQMARYTVARWRESGSGHG